MRKFASWAKRGLYVLSPLPLLAAMTASAAGPSDQLPSAVRAAMQRDLGLDAAQLAQYLKIERLAEVQGKPLAAAQGRNYAGSWIERAANGQFKVVVATTSLRAPTRARSGVGRRATRSTRSPGPTTRRRPAAAGP